MYTQEYAPWENYPKILTHRELMNPLNVVTEFFSIDWVTGHKKKLKKWRYYVVHDQIYGDKNHPPGNLIFTYELTVRLLEALFILYYNYANKTVNKTVSNNLEIDLEKDNLDWYPKNLKRKELRNPYKAVKRIFKRTCLQQYRDYLNEWLYAALYKERDEGLQDREIRKIYTNTLKVYSLAWLIYNRNLESVK